MLYGWSRKCQGKDSHSEIVIILGKILWGANLLHLPTDHPLYIATMSDENCLIDEDLFDDDDGLISETIWPELANAREEVEDGKTSKSEEEIQEDDRQQKIADLIPKTEEEMIVDETISPPRDVDAVKDRSLSPAGEATSTDPEGTVWNEIDAKAYDHKDETYTNIDPTLKQVDIYGSGTILNNLSLSQYSSSICVCRNGSLFIFCLQCR